MLRSLGARSLVLVVMLLMAAPHAGRAWGVLGHRAVARIAENHLTPAARQQVSQILGWETMPLVSTWADELRADPQYKETAPWHYLNVASGLDFAAFVKQLNDPALLAPAAPTNAYTALLQARRDLKDPKKTADEKRVALKFLIHIVGDVHQPLHVGHAEDKGGNTIAVNWRAKDDSNLHSVWDTAILEYPGFTFTEMSATYDHATPAEIKQWQKDDITTWVFESYQLCTPIYAAAATNPKFDWHFYPTFGPVAQQQVLKAGIRLAGQLNELFAK
ncbi:S1/P1 nuclease [Hymenobacter sp. DH14]|uniref:S1/P1 nuclease n=1 Tax=Hymenobacter cyanobacteriorum TaxID=2926463 RepID=A0A9X2AIL6_9BACT|nr:S1/P1 nuclease [Hymenobacter cyanobacteriorum]MCI1188770.1 S1/P1 nuclease [Hymenobacter cyanobacteriorum]